MAPPKFADLNKQASDIFNKGYFFNVFKLDIKTRTENKVNFNIIGEHNTETTRTVGSLETKYVVPQYGLTFLEKWNTDNLLKVEVTADDQLAQGFKLVFDGSLSPQTGKKTADLRTSFVHDKAHVETNIGFDAAGPILNGAVVLGHQGWLAGYQYVYSTAKAALTKNNFAVGFKGRDFTLFANLNDGNEVGGSVYQRLNNRLETGVQLAWAAGTNQTRFALASKYQIDPQTAVGLKVNNICQVGVSFQQLLRPGAKLTLSGLFEVRNLNAGGHKVGLGLELES
ncbi:unnamed protein product [Adineta ricciae]|uniref:Voltage-dependent anion-selective channel protein 3 n=1 Tax=Adineta ricciae TaxID=249248 RepID=A0A815S150_ADIRI|nr:unnamed protein product [Adineta ricciae]